MSAAHRQARTGAAGRAAPGRCRPARSLQTPEALRTRPLRRDERCAATWRGPRLRASRLQPSDLQYLGAFRLPERADGAPEVATWDYGGQALTYRPDGDPHGPADGFPGSLFGTGLDTEHWVSEIAIPVTGDLAEQGLGGATHRLHPAAVRRPARDAVHTLHRDPADGPRLPRHPPDRPQAAHGVGPALPGRPARCASPATPGATRPSRPPTCRAPGGSATSRCTASTATSSRSPRAGRPPTSGAGAWPPVATGTAAGRGWGRRCSRTRRGCPATRRHPARTSTWCRCCSTPAPSRTRPSFHLNGYQHCDEWEGGAWITTPSGRSAVVFAGTKGVGEYYWYGWLDPSGNRMPCVEMEPGGEPMCFQADGSPCPTRAGARVRRPHLRARVVGRPHGGPDHLLRPGRPRRRGRRHPRAPRAPALRRPDHRRPPLPPRPARRGRRHRSRVCSAASGWARPPTTAPAATSSSSSASATAPAPSSTSGRSGSRHPRPRP